MALITCPECGNQVSENAAMCPQRGYVLKENPITKIKVLFTEHKQLVCTGFAVLILLIICVVFASTRLNKYEQLSLEACEALKQMLISPNSFVLYDDIIIYPNFEAQRGKYKYNDWTGYHYGPEPPEDFMIYEEEVYKYDTILFITYGAANRYGGMSKDVAVFEGNEYIGSIEDRFYGRNWPIKHLYEMLTEQDESALYDEINSGFTPQKSVISIDSNKITKALEK